MPHPPPTVTASGKGASAALHRERI
jgi:hypothetical protein